LRDGSQFLLNENTDLGIAYPVLRLYHGEVFARVPHTGAFHVVVRTDAAVAAVEGTQFDISSGLVGRTADTVVTVVEGKVRLSNQLGNVLVEAGEEASANPNTAPTQPRTVAVGGIVKWTSRVQLTTTIDLPPHFSTPRAATLAAAAALAWLAGRPEDPSARLTLADAEADQGKAVNARNEYRRALSLLPNTQRVLRERAEIGIAATSFALADPAGTKTAATAALALNPQSLDGHLLVADTALAKGDLVGALAEDRAAAALFPDNARPQAALGVVFLLQRKPNPARGALNAALRLKPPAWLKADILTDLADLASLLGDRPGVLNYSLQAVQADPRSSAAWTGVGTSLAGLGRYFQALKPLKTAIRLGATFERAIALDNLGEDYYELGNITAELVVYRTALALSPSDAVAANGLGTSDLALGDLEQAVRYTRQAAILAPNLSDLSADYARALWAAHRYTEAAAVVRAALQRDPTNPSLELVLGYALDGLGQAKAAKAAYSAAYGLRPSLSGGAEDAALAGELAYYAGRSTEAITDLRLSTMLHPANFRAWQMLALVEEQLLNNRAALADAGQALALNARDTVSLLVVGQIDFRLKDDHGAIAAYQAVLRIAPNTTSVHAGIGLIYQRSGQFMNALAQFLAEVDVQNEPVNHGPSAADSLAADWSEVGLSYDALHDIVHGAASWAEALRFNPKKGAYYLALGRDQQALGRTSEALHSFTAAIGLDAKDSSAYFDRGALELRLHRTTDAARDFNYAVTWAPRDGPSRLLYGIVLSRERHFSAARVQLTVAVSLFRGDPLESAAWDQLGQVEDGLRDFAAAAAAYGHAVKLDPSQPTIHSELGLDLLRTSQWKAARAQFVIVVAQRPRDSFAYLDLAFADQQLGALSLAAGEVRQQIQINRHQKTLLVTDFRVLGGLELRQSLWKKAIDDFTQVVVNGGRTDQDYYYLGYAQKQAGDSRDALVSLQRAQGLAKAAKDSALLAAICKELKGLGAAC
jgi:tetratricopeptide (TPR) repeat protein